MANLLPVSTGRAYGTQLPMLRHLKVYQAQTEGLE